MQMFVFVCYPHQFLNHSRVRLSWYTVLYQSKNTQALPRCVGGTFTPSLSTLTSPGGRKNFAPVCFSSACIRCAFNINPVYRSSGSGKQHGSQWVWGQTSSEFRSGGNSHCHLQQAGRQTLSLSGYDEEASLVE
ncbi:hypothetical protein CHARACLAT_031819 [Characodon lateralis]|uniref:Uncharacterized protein n=1 Tax=Characodon lateralis TaxID=208331 RepID=A0ABU7CTP8_9TELE|nr:hypothetical protein [Characodon lateralis]